MTISHKKLGLLLGFIGMCLFAGTLPATRLAVSGFDPLFLTVARAALAGSAALIVLLITRRRLPPRSLWLEMFVAAVCTVVGFPLFAALAMMTVPAAHGGVVLGTRLGIQVNGHLSCRIWRRKPGFQPALLRRVLTLPFDLLARTRPRTKRRITAMFLAPWPAR